MNTNNQELFDDLTVAIKEASKELEIYLNESNSGVLK